MSAFYTTGRIKQPVKFIVDDADDKLLEGWKFYQHSKGYIAAHRRVNGTRQLKYLHQLLLPYANKGCQIDHRDGDVTNNRRSNLRACTVMQQAMNRKTRFRASGLPRGVIKHKTLNLYRARLHAQGKTIELGYHKTAQEAGAAYQEAAKQLFGEFMRDELIANIP